MTSESIYLDLGGCDIGISPQSITGTTFHRRTRRPTNVNPLKVIGAGRGKTRRAGREASSLYRYLIQQLPELLPQLDIIFGAATCAGRPYELLLTQPFDVERVDGVEPFDDPRWDKALELIDTGRSVSPSLMSRALLGLLSRQQLVAAFGPGGETYNPRLRKRHRAVLLGLQEKFIKQGMLSPDEIDQVVAAEAALELQRMIR